MTLTRYYQPKQDVWPAFPAIGRLHEDLNRLFDLPFNGDSTASQWMPALDVYENENAYVATLEVPGVNRDDIKVSVLNDELLIEGERKAEATDENTAHRRRERIYGRFQRSITLNSAVDAGKVTAAFKDGVLTVTLPKAEAAKPKQINIVSE